MIDRKQVENVKYFNYLGSLMNSDVRCACEIKSGKAVTEVAFNKKNTLFTSRLGLNLRKKLIKCYIWSVAFCGAETWTFGKVDQKYQESLKCGAGEGWRRSVGRNV
jgi:hypothetical protein